MFGCEQVGGGTDSVQVVSLSVVEASGLLDIRISSVLQLEPCKFLCVQSVDQRYRRHTFSRVRPAGVGELVQGRPSLVIGVRIGSLFDQILREREVAVCHRDH